MNLVLVLLPVFLALGAAVNAGSPQLGTATTAVGASAAAAVPTPAPTPTPAPPAPMDIISGGGPT